MVEIQVGMGMRGKLLAAEYFDVILDIMFRGKSIVTRLFLACITGNAENQGCSQFWRYGWSLWW
jgi:4-aminobutyrate aminotransferase-like enzyme